MYTETHDVERRVEDANKHHDHTVAADPLLYDIIFGQNTAI